MTQRFAFKIAYLGWNYQGFQRQKEPIQTIEATIIKALEEINIISESVPMRYISAGRTDKGVHALSQVIAFNSLKKEIYLEEINQYLPSDIFAWGIAKVSSHFNPRRDASKRTYKMLYPKIELDTDLLTQALNQLIGTHNFIKLSKRPDILPSGQKKSTILTLEEAKVKINKKTNTFEFTFSSQSFLWHQVRKMVSLVLDIASGKYSLDIFDDIFNPESKLPKGGIKPVPPDGLILYDVAYPDINFKTIKKKGLIKSKLMKELKTYTSRLAILNLLDDKI
jgi:tRNA pseudouridine38-40 synthase